MLGAAERIRLTEMLSRIASVPKEIDGGPHVVGAEHEAA